MTLSLQRSNIDSNQLINYSCSLFKYADIFFIVVRIMFVRMTYTIHYVFPTKRHEKTMLP